jgi:two-component system, OmpR family, phosphate regulon sensor histidine kinase PhoR
MGKLEREYPSLRAHLIGILGVFAALFLGLALYLYFTSRTLFAEALQRELSGDLAWISSLIKADPGILLSPTRSDSLCRAISNIKGFRITVIDTSGHVRADSHIPILEIGSLENHATRPEIRDATDKSLGYSWRYSKSLGMQMLYAACQLPNHSGYLRIAAGPSALESFQKASWRIFLIFLTFFLTGSIAVIWWISRKISSPLIHLIGAEIADAKSPPPRWEAEFQEAEILNRAFKGYVGEIQKLAGDVETERDKLVAIMNQLEEGIVILSAEGLVLAANPSSVRLLDSEVPGHLASGTPWLMQPASQVLSHKSLIAWVNMPPDLERPPFLHIDKGPDSQFDLLCHLVPLDSTSASREYLLTLINITEFRHLDRVKSEFVANASHELKTPLSSIKGYAEALLEGALENAKMREPFVKKIHNNALRLERLVQDLLSLSHLEANPAPKETERLPLRGYLNAAVNLHRQEMDGLGIRLENHISDELLVEMEPRDLELILNNLVGNATKYNRPGGKIKVWTEKGESLKLFVKDTGIGIPEEMLPRIFERFYRAGASRASKEGTGLGLAIVKHAASKYGMAVTVESTIGEGSRFQVDIPLTMVDSRPLPGSSGI